MRSVIAPFAAIAVLLFASQPAFAISGTQARGVPDLNGYGVDLGLYLDSQDDGTVFALSPILSAVFHLTDSLVLNGDWGMAFFSGPVGPDTTESAFKVGNPYVAINWVNTERQVDWSAGVGVAIPVASADANDGAQLAANLGAYATAIGMRGMWDAWLWSTEVMSVVIPLAAETSIADSFSVGVDLAPYFMIPTSSENDETEVMLQFAAEGVYEGGSIYAGLRLQGVWNATSDANDTTQLALEPFVAFPVGGGVIAARLLMNLDEPLGFAFDDKGMWGLHVGWSDTF